ncbi:MAG: phage scaffolding protein, partial [Fusobacteriaceae bacterium]
AELDRRNSKSFENFKKDTLSNYVEKAKLDEIEKEYISQLNNVKIDSEIEKVLAGVKHSNLLKSQINKSDLKIEDGKVVGLDEQLSNLKEQYADLFQVEPIQKVTPPAPKNPIPVGYSKLDFKKMSIAEKTKLYLEDRETYNNISEV